MLCSDTWTKSNLITKSGVEVHMCGTHKEEWPWSDICCVFTQSSEADRTFHYHSHTPLTSFRWLCRCQAHLSTIKVFISARVLVQWPDTESQHKSSSIDPKLHQQISIDSLILTNSLNLKYWNVTFFLRVAYIAYQYSWKRNIPLFN